jgi:DNA-binding response OmpR family regulator
MNTPNVLIIEDEKPIANALLAKCAQRGLAPKIASDGEEGLKIALAENPDIILLDLMMPKMDGTEFMHRIRQDAWGATVPIIVLTNLSPDSQELIKAVVEGAPEFYRVKSDWKIDDITTKIWQILDPEGVH